MESFDTIVIGGGITGASTARALAKGSPAQGRKARKVLLIDAHAPGHAHGSSHGDGRIVRFTYPESVYLAMAGQAYPAWAEIERESGESLLETTGGWECGNAGSQIITDLEIGMSQAEIAFERLTAAESRHRFPQFAVSDDQEILYQPEGAVVRADLAVKTLWSLAERAGAKLITDQRVTSIKISKHGNLQVLCADLGFEAASLVITAGGWSRNLLEPLGLDLPLTVNRETIAYFPPRRPDGPDHGFRNLPTLVEYDRDQVFFALPQIDIAGVKVGWHHAGPEADPNIDGDVDPNVLRGIADYVERRFPHLETSPIKALTCLYTNTPDYHFVLDRHPELPQIAIGTGFSGHGFKFGPVAGEILAQFATGEESTIDTELFRIDRFSNPALRRRTGA